jgi:formate dehydrogenase maturation protein FdhE
MKRARTFETEITDLRGRMEAVAPTVEFYLKREIESPSNHQEFAREAAEKLARFRAALDAPTVSQKEGSRFAACPACGSKMRSIRYDVRVSESEYKSELCANTWHDAPAGKGDSNGQA